MSAANTLPLPAEIDRLCRVNAVLVAASEAVIADLTMRAKLEDQRDPVLNVSNGVLELFREAIVNAKASA